MPHFSTITSQLYEFPPINPVRTITAGRIKHLCSLCKQRGPDVNMWVSDKIVPAQRWSYGGGNTEKTLPPKSKHRDTCQEFFRLTERACKRLCLCLI